MIRKKKYLILSVLLFLSAILIVRVFLFSIYTVHGHSMEKTYYEGDKVLVNMIKKPKQQDIVVVSSGNGSYIKRYVGGPGDKIQIVNKALFINDKRIDDANAEWDEGKGSLIDVMTIEQFGVNWSLTNFGPLTVPKKGMTMNMNERTRLIYLKLIASELEMQERLLLDSFSNVASYRFQSDYCFLLGDNRLNSDDSRRLGLFLLNRIIGVAEMKLFNIK